MKPTPGSPQTFYRWEDASGRMHIVSSLEHVPQAERPDAKGAVEQMKLRQKQQEEELKKIQAER